MAKILSQDEIDALLSTVSSEVETQVAPTTERGESSRSVATYDFSHPSRVSKDQLRTIRNIHENVCKLLSSSLSGFQRTVVDVELVDVAQLTYAEFILSLASPSCSYTFSMDPLEGEAIIEFSPTIAFAFVDRAFGGEGTAFTLERSLTGIERSIVDNVAARVLEDLEESWKQLYKVAIEMKRFETNPEFMQVVPSGEIVISITLEVKSPTASGLLNICYPYMTLEPVIIMLSGQHWLSSAWKKKQVDPKVMEDSLQHVQSSVQVQLGTTQVTVRDLLELEEGHVICLDMKKDAPVVVFVEDRPKFYARPGLLGTRKAIEILSQIEEESE